MTRFLSTPGEDRVDGSNSIVLITFKVHLSGQHTIGQAAHLQVNVGRSSNGTQIVGTRYDGLEQIGTILSGPDSPEVPEVGVELIGRRASRVFVVSAIVGLPDLNRGSGQGPALVIPDAAEQVEQLSGRPAGAAGESRQITQPGDLTGWVQWPVIRHHDGLAAQAVSVSRRLLSPGHFGKGSQSEKTG